MRLQWFETTQEHPFILKEAKPIEKESPHAIVITGKHGQTLRGFGGCFNELGYQTKRIL